MVFSTLNASENSFHSQVQLTVVLKPMEGICHLFQTGDCKNQVTTKYQTDECVFIFVNIASQQSKTLCTTSVVVDTPIIQQAVVKSSWGLSPVHSWSEQYLALHISLLSTVAVKNAPLSSEDFNKSLINIALTSR